MALWKSVHWHEKRPATAHLELFRPVGGAGSVDHKSMPVVQLHSACDMDALSKRPTRCGPATQDHVETCRACSYRPHAWYAANMDKKCTCCAFEQRMCQKKFSLDAECSATNP